MSNSTVRSIFRKMGFRQEAQRIEGVEIIPGSDGHMVYRTVSNLDAAQITNKALFAKPSFIRHTEKGPTERGNT